MKRCQHFGNVSYDFDYRNGADAGSRSSTRIESGGCGVQSTKESCHIPPVEERKIDVDLYVSYRCTHAPAAGYVRLCRRNPPITEVYTGAIATTRCL